MEKLCLINKEVSWLLKNKTPHNRTIANFLKDNTEAIKSLFKNFNLALKSWELIEGKEFAVDSTKIRANNSNSKSFNQKTIDNKKKYHHSRAEAFTKAFEEAQQKGDQQAIKKIKKLKKKNEESIALWDERQKQLNDTSESTSNLTDKDSKSVMFFKSALLLDIIYKLV